MKATQTDTHVVSHRTSINKSINPFKPPMNTIATSLDQFGPLHQIAQLFIREKALDLGSCHHYELVVCPERAVRLLRELKESLYFSGVEAADRIVLETLLNAGAETQVPLYIEMRDYMVVQMLGYNLLFAACAPTTSIKTANVSRRHERPYYG